jgi:Fur family ferric uptake transcriptional regulator
MAPRRRETKQRAAVSAVLDEVDSFISAQQLYSPMHQMGEGVGLATVYRTLQHLAEDGELDVVRSDDNETMYRRCSSGHHHHLVCRDCQRTVEVDSAAVERWAARTGADHGFSDISHVVEVAGSCPDCDPTSCKSRSTPRKPATGRQSGDDHRHPG